MRKSSRKIKDTKTPTVEGGDTALSFLKSKLAELAGKPAVPGAIPGAEPDTKQQEVADILKNLKFKQQEITQAAREAVKQCELTPQMQQLLASLERTGDQPEPEKSEQAQLMEHLLKSLQGKEVETKLTKQKEILKQFLVDANKTTTSGGATTLKPDILKKLTGESDVFNMAEWLSKLNRHDMEEGKCDNCPSEECKKCKKSGMLDKATTNIQHKEDLAPKEPPGGLG